MKKTVYALALALSVSSLAGVSPAMAAPTTGQNPLIVGLTAANSAERLAMANYIRDETIYAATIKQEQADAAARKYQAALQQSMIMTSKNSAKLLGKAARDRPSAEAKAQRQYTIDATAANKQFEKLAKIIRAATGH